jgi:hypothetical protein
MKKDTYILFLLLFISSNFFAQSSDIPPWELVKEKGPLKVYTRNSLDSDIKELRITTTMNASIDDFVDALSDADSYKEWVYKCESSKLVQKISDSELYYHVETDFPFPLSDRDLVVHTKQRFDETGVFYSDSFAISGIRPEEKGVVRIDLFESHWKVTAQNDKSIIIDYNSKVDPAGNIPLWVVNLGLTVGPVKSLERFTQFVEEWRSNN